MTSRGLNRGDLSSVSLGDGGDDGGDVSVWVYVRSVPTNGDDKGMNLPEERER